jgi:single-strand DNA-binding protein
VEGVLEEEGGERLGWWGQPARAAAGGGRVQADDRVEVDRPASLELGHFGVGDPDQLAQLVLLEADQAPEGTLDGDGGRGSTMTEAAVSFAGNLTDQPEVRYTESSIARAMFRVAVSGRRDQEASFFTVVVWRDQAEHAAESLSKGRRVVIMGRLQQRSWTAEDGSARSVVEVVAEELGASLRWATATTTRTTRSQEQASTA